MQILNSRDRNPHLRTMNSIALSFVALLLISAGGCSRVVTEPPADPHHVIDLAAEAEFADLQRRPDSPPARLDPDRRTVFVPLDQRLSFFLRLAGDSTLSIDQMQHSGVGLYRVLFQRDGQQEIVLDEVEGSQRTLEYLLPAGESEFVSLSFASRADADQEGGLLLVEPRVRVSSAPPKTAGGADPQTSRPNIIIFLSDTLRKDHLGVYGYDLPVSPNLEDFAGVSTVYEHAVAQSPWTRPSVASIFTGLEPHLHTVNDRPDALPHEVRTLAEALSEEGYETAAFITNGNVGAEYQFDQGFDHFSRSFQLQHRAHQLNDRILAYLDGRPTPQDRPLFLYVHAMEPHAPYQPPEAFRERFAPRVEDPKFGEIEYLNSYHKRQETPDRSVIDQALALYDAEIAFLDAQFGRLMSELRSRGLFENSLIIFVSDHGEEFWEHGDWSHGQSLYGELLDMPLLIKEPGQQRPRRSNRLVQHIDLFPTAMDWVGGTANAVARGQSLRSPETGNVSAYSKLDMDGRIGVSVIQDNWKLIDPRTGNLGFRPQLFDRSADPGELHDLWADRPIVGGYLLSLLRRHEAPSPLAVAAAEIEASEELARELEALGYIN